MAYDHYQIEREAAFTTNAGALVVSPGYSPIILRAAAVVITTTTATADITFNVEFRDPAGGTATVLDTIVVPTGTTAGSVIYVDGLNQRVAPGQDINIEGQGGTGTGAGSITAFYQPCWEHPDNNTDMTESA